METQESSSSRTTQDSRVNDDGRGRSRQQTPKYNGGATGVAAAQV